MVECKPCSTPTALKSATSALDDLPYSQPSFYRSLVGALRYLTITRPNFAFIVKQACQHMQTPTLGHFAMVKRLLRYVKGTIHHGLHFSDGPFTLHAFSNTSWSADCSD